jgi:hypothetical protein
MKALVLFAVSASLVAACNKVNVYTTTEKPQPTTSPNQIVQTPSFSLASRPPSAQERIAEIEKELAAPLSGKPDDADHRAQLRAERDALIGQSTMNSTARSAPAFTASATARNPATGIIVAPDTQAGTNRLGWEGLAPSEKKDYLRLIRATRPGIVIQDDRH